MNDLLAALEQSIAALRAAWAGDGERVPGAAELDRSRLLSVNEAIGAVRRQLDAVHAPLAAEIARQSRSELGKDGLARKAGFRTPATLIAAVTGTTTGDAARLVSVGEAIAPRMTLTGEAMPPRHPHVADAQHALGCSASSLSLATTTVVVRMSLEDLESGRGVGTIDGIAQPVSAETVRRLAANGNIIPCVLGGQSEILDWGRARRLFTPAQRLALVERDGGCAFCGLPPGFTEAHHLRWWTRHAGPTDLDNGILLCTRCHHRVHDDGWEIRIDGAGTAARVWFIPPVWLDAARTPRLGGRARFDFALVT